MLTSILNVALPAFNLLLIYMYYRVNKGGGWSLSESRGGANRDRERNTQCRSGLLSFSVNFLFIYFYNYSVEIWAHESKFLFQNKLHYENIMNNKVLPQIKEAEAKYLELEKDRKVDFYVFLDIEPII